MRYADASVIAAPHPTTDWNVRLSSTSITATLESTATLLKWRSGSRASSRDWSPAVTQTETLLRVETESEELRPVAHAARRTAPSGSANDARRDLDLMLRTRGC